MTGRIIEKFVILFSWLCGFILLGVVSILLAYLLTKGYQALNQKLIFGNTAPLDALLFKRQVFDGLFPAIIGTLVIVVTSVLIAIPAGIAAGIYMSEYSKPPFKFVFSLIFDVLAGIPSVVVGLFGFSVTIFLHHRFFNNLYPCLLISAVSLAFLVLPYLIRTTQESLENVPPTLRQTGIALGATKLQNIYYVLIPESISGIITGVILAIGRCAEDTAVIMLTGVVASSGIPRSIFANYEALPFYIYYISSQYMNAEELAKGYGAAIILLTICSFLYLLTFLIKRRLKNIIKKRG
ncbi:MAG: phosphate ABC transporter permease PstA [Proteobacteria bacterium]|nr:phosphate ABC transporter permease PstA [Pseudomonadota bacterium]